MARVRCGNEERENMYWMEREEKRCRVCYEERETIGHMWNGCSEMREREGKKREETLKEDRREIGWIKEIWKSTERIEKERGEGISWNCYFMFRYNVLQNPKARR
jgi:hypothetical protein